MRTEERSGKQVLFPKGRIDAENAQKFYDEVSEAVAGREPKTFELNLEELEYISSAGLRSLLRLKKEGWDIAITEASSAVYEIFSVTGFTEMFSIRKAYRKMSVDGCKRLGSGFFGAVYRYNEDTIVKVYNIPDCIPIIENEQKRAKVALLNGIPTAISYDVVRVGDRYGAVFELLEAKSFNDITIEHPEKADEMIRRFVDFMKYIHTIEIEPGSLPSAKDMYLENLELAKRFFSDAQYRTIRSYLEQFPEDHHVVHGDLHMKNVMLVNDEPMLIDMDSLCLGHPLFDLAGIYAVYISFTEVDPTNCLRFWGVPEDVCIGRCKKILRAYFNGISDEVYQKIEKKIILTATVRMLCLIAMSGREGDLEGRIVKRGQEVVSKLLEEIDGLYFTIE